MKPKLAQTDFDTSAHHLIVAISMPSIRHRPEVGRSKHPIKFIIVLLPEPLEPITAQKLPRSKRTLTPSIAHFVVAHGANFADVFKRHSRISDTPRCRVGLKTACRCHEGRFPGLSAAPDFSGLTGRSRTVRPHPQASPWPRGTIRRSGLCRRYHRTHICPLNPVIQTR